MTMLATRLREAGHAEAMPSSPDPEVPEQPKRRRFSAAYKARVLAEADACSERGQIGSLLRREGLYSSHLTAWRAALVNAKTLAKIAEELNFNQYILLSRGEAKDTGKARQVILANAFEAFLGALYLDGGYEESAAFIGKYILPILPAIIKEQSYKDAKSLFQEIAQDKRGVTPKYSVLKEWGPDHAKTFRMGVFLGDELAGEGEGVSKQDAEQEAAKDALAKMKWHL